MPRCTSFKSSSDGLAGASLVSLSAADSPCGVVLWLLGAALLGFKTCGEKSSPTSPTATCLQYGRRGEVQWLKPAAWVDGHLRLIDMHAADTYQFFSMCTDEVQNRLRF
jgi:hypothetical protein